MFTWKDEMQMKIFFMVADHCPLLEWGFVFIKGGIISRRVFPPSWVLSFFASPGNLKEKKKKAKWVQQQCLNRDVYSLDWGVYSCWLCTAACIVPGMCHILS